RVEPTEEEVELAVNEKLSNYENDPRNLQMLDAKSTDENGEVVDTNMVVTKTGNISLSHRRGSRGFQMEIDATSHEIKKAQIMDSQNGESTYQTIDPNAHEVVDMFTIATDHLARAVEEHEQSNATSRQQTIQSLIA
ncbi:MAG TPA: hypothetical protein PKD20_01555, partial [Candidatus Saccharibacteria bacterium]|nr:hypothetical protein [Candidatus Saccharibacteria bacterium]